MFKFFKDQVLWAWGGLFIILSSLWGLTQITVQLSYWRRDFFDMIQVMLTTDGGEIANLFSGMWEFGLWAGLFVLIVVLTDYLTQRWLLSWRESVMWYYHNNWTKLRHVEGSSQRVQEDCKLFTRLLESIGEGAVTAIMTLIAFGPILWELSKLVPDLLILNIAGGLMWSAILWAVGGTIVLVWLGRKLPGLEFLNQKAEAALRKELVLGEDDVKKANQNIIKPLWANVQYNYKRLFLQYMSFGLGKWSYLQFSVLVPLILVSPSIATGVITFGILMQLLDAFGRVEQSFQFLLRSWTTIVEFLSVYKRLSQFETHLK